MIDYLACILFLIPDAHFGIKDTYESIVWNDPRPQPTKAQCEAVWPQVQAQQATAAQAAIDAAANEKTIGDQVDAALASNATYLAIASPTNAQVAAQVKALTKQNNGIIRLLRKKLDQTG